MCIRDRSDRAAVTNLELTQDSMRVNFKRVGRSVRRWSRLLHRDLSYLLATLIFIYALSGLYMNHRDSINPHYIITQREYQIPLEELQAAGRLDAPAVRKLLDDIDLSGSYTKHYYPDDHTLKVFLKGRATLLIDTSTGVAVYESIERRPLISSMTRLHYNPGRWWTIVADVLAIGLILITLTGLLIVPGRRGLIGRGGILLLIGLAVPLLFLFL